MLTGWPSLLDLPPSRIWNSNTLLSIKEKKEVLDWFLTEDMNLNLSQIWREMECELQNESKGVDSFYETNTSSNEQINKLWKNYLNYIDNKKSKNLDNMTHKQVYAHAGKQFPKMYFRRILQIQLLNYQQKKVHYPRKTTGYIFPNNNTIFSDEWKKKTVNTNFEPM